MKEITILVIDNSTIFRDGLRQSFTRREDIQIVADSSINEEALELIASFLPEVVLLDIGPPLLTGLNLARQIIQRSPGILIAALTPYDNDEYLFQAIKSGAVGFLSKDTTADELASAIRRIHRGEHTINELVLTRPKVAERVLRQFKDFSLMGKAIESFTAPLTSRELEILNYVACGYVNKQVAYKLGISEQTIKNHMSSILRKLDANDRTQAVVTAIRNGWISSEISDPSEPTISHEVEDNLTWAIDPKESLRSLLTALERL